MKRLFIILFITLALVVGAAGAAPAAHAAITCPQDDQILGADDLCHSFNADGVEIGSGVEPIITEDTLTPPVDPAAARAVAGGLPSNPSGSEGFNKVMIWIMGLFAWLVGVAALTLDYAVYYTVVTMGNYVNNLSAVGVTWQIMRDIGNIIFIFGFLAIGICTILDVKWYGGGTSMLPKLLLGAVFLNFSLFMTEAIIDTGNLFATQFYTQIKGGQLPTPASLSQTTIENEGISTKIMSQLGFQNIYGELRNTERAEKVLKGGNQWVVGFMGILLFLITAFVMFSLAFVLIARFVILLFLIIVAPIGFAGLAIPNLGGLAKKWWDKLVQQTITAPILLLCLYIALRIITDVNFLTGFRSADSAPDWFGTISNNVAAFAPLLLSFLVAMGLLIAVVIISKSLSAFGADKASSLASKLSGMSIAAAAPGWVGRHTVGLGANYAAKKLRGTAFGRSFVGRGFADTLEKKVASASFDVRNTDLGKSAAGVGLDLGKGQKGGYKADLEERVKSYERAAAGMKGDSEKEKEEKAAVTQAEANKKAAEIAQNKAKAEYDKVAPALKQERDRLNAEVEQLEKEKAQAGVGTFRANEIDKRLTPAREARDKSATALKEAEDKLSKAESDLTKATTNETAAIKNVGNAKKEAQKQYAKRLENVWGPIWGFGSAAAAAVPRVRGSIGKSKTEQEVEALLKAIKEKTGESGAEEAPKKEEKK